MKFAVFGLGNFGSSLCIKLSALGHEVIGVDKNFSKVESLKDKITMAVSLDSTDESAMTSLPIKQFHTAVIAIGENEGASVMTTALVKKMGADKIISRAISPLHQTVLESMGVDEVIHPEEDSAERLAYKLNYKKIVETIDLTDGYTMTENTVPDSFIGKSLEEINPMKQYKVNIITILRKEARTNILGSSYRSMHTIGVLNKETVFESGDILLLFGNKKDIHKLLQSQD